MLLTLLKIEDFGCFASPRKLWPVTFALGEAQDPCIVHLSFPNAFHSGGLSVPQAAGGLHGRRERTDQGAYGLHFIGEYTQVQFLNGMQI